MHHPITEADIEAAKTPDGGWTRQQFAAWGLSWPPTKGWKQQLLDSGYKVADKSALQRDVELSRVLRAQQSRSRKLKPSMPKLPWEGK